MAVSVYGPNVHAVDTTLYYEDIFVEMKVVNKGSKILDTIYFHYHQGVKNKASETWTGQLNPADTLVYKFNKAYLSPIGYYKICGEVSVHGDNYNMSDTLCKALTGIVGIQSHSLPGFVLYQNIPNPASGETQINYYIPCSGKVNFELFDQLGRVIKMDQSQKSKGKHSIVIDTDQLASGLYYYSITFDGYRLLKKMVVNGDGMK